VPSSRPELTGLTLGGTPEAWERFGFGTTQGEVHVGGVRLQFDGGEPGIRGWTLDGEGGTSPAHPNGVIGIDHVVALTNDVDEAVRAFTERGFDHRRTHGDAERRQAFFVLGPCLLEIVGDVQEAGGFALWGVTFVANDVEQYAGAKDAVQPGRRIATVPREAGLGFPVALITPR
jgi:hypothetical protein